MSSKKNTTKTSRFQLPCTMYSTFDPQHRGPPFLAKKQQVISQEEEITAAAWIAVDILPSILLAFHTAKFAQQKFRPPKETTFSSCTLWVWEYPKNVANLVLFFLNLAIFGKSFGKTYFWRKSRLHVLKNSSQTWNVLIWATKKNPYYFPLYWLVNRDPYNVYYNPQIIG